MKELFRPLHCFHAFASGRIDAKIRKNWEKFYLDAFGMDTDLSVLTIPDNPGDFDRVVVVVCGISVEAVIAEMRKYFKVLLYRDGLCDADMQDNERSSVNGSYAIRVRAGDDADHELHDLSAENVKARGISTMTLLERLLLELKYFIETGEHLDRVTLTFCTGSRDREGNILTVDWSLMGLGLGVGSRPSNYIADGLIARRVII